MPRIIFRKEALNRLRSPEQLDEAMKITSPKGWIALLAAFLVIGSCLAWGFWARIPIKFPGYGILVYSGRLTEVVANGAGILKDTYVRDGQVVRKGQLLAVLDIPALTENMQLAQENYDELLAQEKIYNLESKLSSKRWSASLLDHQLKLDQQKRRVQYLHEQLTSMTQVRAPFDGIVMEVTTYPIARVTQGSPLFILSPVGVPNRDLVASVFVSALQGKHIEVGDEVEIELSTVRPEEHGYMRGKVSSVAILPATSQAVRSILKIGGLSAYVQKQFRVAPLYVEIEPERKFRSRTGYSWTAREPLNQVMPGSVVKVYIRVDENRPIDYLIPIFERIL